MADIHALFDALLAQKGSDLHLSPGLAPMLRLKGDLMAMPNVPTVSGRGIEDLVLPLLSDSQKALFLSEYDLDFAYAYRDIARFRGNLLGTVRGTGAVFRIIPSRVQSADELKLPASIVRLSQAKSGLILVTGPTGSGKSTTLAAMLDSINQTRAGHILTVEDPVEFVHQPKRCAITHREVGRDVASFADAIRSAGREDADVILVGELRGPETMRLALQAATGGALVFATVHTNSAPTTIDRFINAFAAEQQSAVRGMLSESLTGIVAQQLLKKADGSGRVAVHEILIGNRAVASMIREGKTTLMASLIQSSRSEGMQSMDDTLLSLVKDATLRAHDALAKATDKESFAKHPAVALLLDQGAAH